MRLAATLFAALLLCAPSLGQDAGSGAAKKARPDFSGIWAFDQSQSNIGPRDSSAGAEWTLVVSHREPEVRADETIVTASGRSELHSVQYTDGRPVRDELYRCKSKWDKKRLVRRCEDLEPRDDASHGRFTERWELSADGRTLTQRVTLPPPSAPRPAFKGLPPGLRVGAEREMAVREILAPRREIRRVFRRVS